MFNYPLTRPGCSYGFLPIEPEWHGKLFPDLRLRNEDMSIYENEPCSYTTEKIYVCGWRDLVPNLAISSSFIEKAKAGLRNTVPSCLC